jgi:hypothetical protein
MKLSTWHLIAILIAAIIVAGFICQTVVEVNRITHG